MKPNSTLRIFLAAIGASTITGTGPLNVTATIPATKAAGGKLFGRLKADNP